MLHAKCESDGNSTPPKSSLSSPKQPLYYVISPTHDSSYDDNKSSPPQTSPLSASPMDSPSHNSRHSHSSASSRVSGFTRKWNRKRGWNHECSVIKEEEDYDCVYCDYERCRCLMAVVGLGVLFALFCLIIWGASRPYQPRVSVKSLTIYNFYSGEGSDFSGVPTKMLTVNCSVKMSIHNPATFFGIHFHSTTVNLIFTQITVATGQFKNTYLPRKGHGILHVNMEGERVPLYGAGASLHMSATHHHKVPLKLDFEIVTWGNVVGKLVTTRHKQHISCSLVVDSRNTKIIMFEEKFCTFE